jgi:hypothetical protein
MNISMTDDIIASMIHDIHQPIAPGTRIRVEQCVLQRADEWRTVVEGEVLSHAMEPTGSWYAHGKADKLWLPRLRIRKDDGELTTLNLDNNSRITLLS